jgi:peptide/nickel transport system permease protein
VVNFLIRKLVQGVLMILVVTAITFVLLSGTGGDALTALRDNPQVSAETVERLRVVYGLDRPASVRYGHWLASMAAGDMGESFFFRAPVRDLVAVRLANTLKLGLLAISIAVGVAVGLSFLSIRTRSKRVRSLIEFIVLITASTPRIVLALAALAISVSLWGTFSIAAGDSYSTLLVAGVVMAFPLIAIFLAQVHEELRRVMDEDFIQLARAKGLSERAVIFRHASRAALDPLLALFGLSLGSVVGGSVIVETILGWPGVGSLMVAAVRGRDVPLVMGIVLAASVAVWLGNAIAEALQLVNDKRLRDSA